ncbi:hypothetical protein [Geodermatophilus sabuli]|uniref:DUF4386 family protein n=1 Tax=Geodermatophilus sabuli TaxID=1564158 RepID=A0A285ECM7_9ACTN|nr:hypothetical protein [Geodermatophilus sabuli]MBB3083539.1 hypothetical protein [Geodermatophilus sabuli]SNX96740.1 hypothetical protein SAMN06893097_10577 [Geodermatophilus sabuli]
MLPIAGGALIAGSLLYVAGMATSPPQDSMAAADYIEALARDEGRTTLSAMLLHYGNMALAWLAAPALVRGRRGRVATIVGALMSAVGLVTVTGFVLYDYWTAAIGRTLDPAAALALALYDSVGGNAAVGVVGILTLFGIVGPLVVYVGLARAGVTGWWLLAPAVAGIAASMAVAFSPLPHAGFALVGAVPTVVVGLRMIARRRAERPAA